MRLIQISNSSYVNINLVRSVVVGTSSVTFFYDADDVYTAEGEFARQIIDALAGFRLSELVIHVRSNAESTPC